MGERVAHLRGAAVSNVGKWNPWYGGLTEPAPYNDTATYKIGAAWLESCETVEDWGTGRGWFKTLRPDAIGIDGSQTPFADVIADLAEYRSQVDGIWMRGVAEHDWQWQKILTNAFSSFTQRMALVMFTPDGPDVEQCDFTAELGVPDLIIPTRFVDDLIPAGVTVEFSVVETDTRYGAERVWLLEAE